MAGLKKTADSAAVAAEAETAVAPKEEKKDIMSDADFQKKVKDTIGEVKQLTDKIEKEINQTEELKIVSMYRIGNQAADLVSPLGPRERRLIIERFHKETGMDQSFFYLSMQVVSSFTRDQFEAMKKNGITVQVLKALASIKDDKLREKAMNKAITEGLDADAIRQIKGTKGARRAAYAQKRSASDKKKPPMRVFSQGLDRVLMVDEAVKSCTDAVTRLPECKTEEERKEAVRVLIEVRKAIPDLVAELNSFMKFTANFSKQQA